MLKNITLQSSLATFSLWNWSLWVRDSQNVLPSNTNMLYYNLLFKKQPLAPHLFPAITPSLYSVYRKATKKFLLLAGFHKPILVWFSSLQPHWNTSCWGHQLSLHCLIRPSGLNLCVSFQESFTTWVIPCSGNKFLTWLLSITFFLISSYFSSHFLISFVYSLSSPWLINP